MANATTAQVQNFADQRCRPHAEAAVALALALLDDIAEIDDVYNALNGPLSGWADNRLDGPPHLLTASDILAFNTFLHDISTAITGHAQYPVIRKMCVRSAAG